MKKIKDKIIAVCLGTAVMCLCAGVFSGKTTAYMSDQEEMVNVFTVGYNTITITEDFPTPTPIDPEKDNPIVKTVRIENTNSVPCYIRVAIKYSNSDIGNYVTLDHLDSTNWEEGNDGYYYYKKSVDPGDSTTALFEGITISKDMDTRYLTETEDFEVICYAESVQTAKGSNPYKDYLEAWEHYTGGGN